MRLKLQKLILISVTCVHVHVYLLVILFFFKLLNLKFTRRALFFTLLACQDMPESSGTPTLFHNLFWLIEFESSWT